MGFSQRLGIMHVVEGVAGTDTHSDPFAAEHRTQRLDTLDHEPQSSPPSVAP